MAALLSSPLNNDGGSYCFRSSTMETGLLLLLGVMVLLPTFKWFAEAVDWIAQIVTHKKIRKVG